MQHWEAWLAATILASAAISATATAQAAHFTCGHRGGDFTYALQANVAGLDQHTTAAASTRDISVNVFETLMTRDEHMKPMLQLARSESTSADDRTFTFKLRQGVTFHNGQPTTSADVMASFRRFQRIGVDRSVLAGVDHFEAPDPETFVIVLKQPTPTFLEAVSVFTVPITIIPKQYENALAQQLPPIGTGPYQVEKFVADGYVKLRRYDGYKPDERFDDISGFGGYKVACLDTVTFRMATDPSARTDALLTGEVQGDEDVPVSQRKQVAGNKNIKLMKLADFWLNVTYPNFSAPPTDNVQFRQAVQAALDLNEIMDAASDGDYKLNPSLQYPGTTYYSEIGDGLYNQHDAARAKKLLAQSGYHGQKVALLTNHDYPVLYNTALAVAQELKAVGINAQLQVLDWPTALQRSMHPDTGWNFFFTGWITYTATGGLQSLRPLASPNPVFTPPGGQSDPAFMQDFHAVETGKTLAARKTAFGRAQQRAMDLVMAIPMGVIPQVSAVRSNVEHYIPYYNPRMYNVWLKN